MDLPRTAAVATRFRWLDRIGSTNSALADLAVGRGSGAGSGTESGAGTEGDASTAPWPHGSVVVTDDQTAGRGRLGRTWSAPSGGSLAVSVLLRPRLRREAWGWLPLLAGVAMADSVATTGVAALVKWPNDVLVADRKLCGVLAEALPDGSGVVIGAGLNHALTEQQLPVPTATSLAVLGVLPDPDGPIDGPDAGLIDGLVDGLLAGFVGGLLALLADLQAAGGDADGSGVRTRVLERCGTIGRRVRVTLPAGHVVEGTAVDIARDGRLVIARADAEPLPVSAGDVEHLRYE